ncbi:MAG: NAD+ synthase (glutamine-hydrolyzing) [Bacteroidia bacterium]|jgi:NAD+ synthase (glutamine-hydrolysing)
MQIRLSQLNYHIGNFEENTRKIVGEVNSAKVDEVDLIVFSELSVCGYPPRDFLEFEDFISRCEKAVTEIAAKCVGITAVVGAPLRNNAASGKSLFNAAFVLADGSIKQVIKKSLLPNYDIFDENRYFEPSREFDVVEVGGVRVALTICEDLWNIEDPLYITSPMDELMKQNPQLMVNIAASPFDFAHREARIRILEKNCKKYGLPILYTNHIGAQTELIFDGGSMALDAQGNLLHELDYFQEDSSTFQYDGNLKLIGEEKNVDTRSKIERIHDAVVLGIKDYFEKLGFKKAVLGLSGGIDSAVVLYLAQKALGAENVRTLLMPSEFSSDHSVDDSVQLSENLGTEYEIVSIENLFNNFQQDLKPLFGNLPFNVAEENLQARTRGVLLMAVSNKFGNILLNTSNKSECAVGYSTIYGDMNGGLAVIADLYKTEVYELARWVNRHDEVIPESIITKAPSAELRPDQKDSDSLPDYDVLDEILIEYIENRKGPAEIIAMGHSEALVNRILRLVNLNEYKRYQTPPILRVSKKAFGMGRRVPIVGKYLC